MKMCVGAVSQLVVECAAELEVDQIVASRRQVDTGGGYIGLDQEGLVALVNGRSTVVRDHGGPHQNGEVDDDWVMSLDHDVLAGFDGLHLDVCKLPQSDQRAELARLVDRYAEADVHLEAGGERDAQSWTLNLLRAIDFRVTYAVIDLGGHIWNDRQIGIMRRSDDPILMTAVAQYRGKGVCTKAHNFDWLGQRTRWDHLLDAVNIAPEFGNVEIDAWLRMIEPDDALELLRIGYEGERWSRWFDPGEGTIFERSRAGLRYELWTDEVRTVLGRYDDIRDDVKEEVKDAIRTG